jgi:hypothetical protein
VRQSLNIASLSIVGAHKDDYNNSRRLATPTSELNAGFVLKDALWLRVPMLHP